jgi:hypothetical protein
VYLLHQCSSFCHYCDSLNTSSSHLLQLSPSNNNNHHHQYIHKTSPWHEGVPVHSWRW